MFYLNKKIKKIILHLQNFHNNFTTNLRWQIVAGSHQFVTITEVCCCGPITSQVSIVDLGFEGNELISKVAGRLGQLKYA